MGQRTGLDRIGQFRTVSSTWAKISTVFSRMAAKRLLANDAPAAGQFAPVNQVAFHPIVDCGPTYFDEVDRVVDGEEPCVSLAVFTEETRR